MRANETAEEFMIRTFSKYCDCPITIEKNPYFTEEIEIKDKFFNTKQKYNMLSECVKAAGSIDNYVDNYNKARNAIVDDIVNSPKYKEFNGENSILVDDYVKYVLKNNDYCHSNIFNDDNIGKKFISVDMKHANMSILQNIGVYDKSITYDDIMNKYNVDKFLANSKAFRQTTFGRTNEKRIGRYELFQMLCMANTFRTMHAIEPVCVLHDEIIFEYTDAVYDTVSSVINTCSKFAGFEYECKAYTLYSINPIKAYIRVYFDRYDLDKDRIASYDDLVEGKYKYDVKSLKKFYSRAVYHWLAGEECTDDDFYFIYEYFICKVVDKIPEFKIVYTK
jgi:hypothetical protein